MHSLSLNVSGLSLSYKNFTLTNISFDLANGSILGLIGRSGSGKSTILKALIGMKKPDDGKIVFCIDGSQAKLNNHIGYSPQQNSLYPFLTIEENLFTFARLNGQSDSLVNKRMETLLPRLDLLKHVHKRVNELSGGMQKRADLAVTLIHDPDILILDEPFNGLDISLQKFIWSLLKELASQGKIVIISSHMLTDIEKNCNQFGLIENNSYYNTEQLTQAMQSSKKSFEDFLDYLFSSAREK
jgi:ABC-type multidrug transport system ATPase subunit